LRTENFQECRLLNNFSTLISIVSALDTAPIRRLDRTWQQVGFKTQKTLVSMRRLITSTKNFALHRDQLHSVNPPCIPFLSIYHNLLQEPSLTGAGVYLTELSLIEDSIASIVKNIELINIAKRAKMAEIIHDIQLYQNIPYSLNHLPELQEWIINKIRHAGDVNEMYIKSLAIEWIFVIR
jgi:son of sevenless